MQEVSESDDFSDKRLASTGRKQEQEITCVRVGQSSGKVNDGILIELVNGIRNII